MKNNYNIYVSSPSNIEESHNQIETFKILVDRLQSTGSRNDKESILREYIDDTTTKEILKFLFDTMITTGLSDKKINKVVHKSFDRTWGNTRILEMLRYVEKNNTGSDNIIGDIQDYIMATTAEPTRVELLKNIFTKNIKLGLSASTLNKVFGKDFIKVHEVMLAQRYYDNPDKLVPEGTEFIITTKLDGARVILVNSDKGPKFISRQGNEFFDLIELEEEAKKLPKGYIYDGELLLNRTDLPSKDLYRETMKIISSDKIKTNINFHCFDLLTINEFNKGISIIPAKKRKEHLIEFTKGMKWFKPVEILYQGKDKSQIEYWLEEITNKDGEGIMINLSNSPYECKRSKGLLKVKKFQTTDIRVIGYEEGRGENIGKLGAFICEFIGPDNELHTVDVGSGFTKVQREEFWDMRDSMINKIIQVKYFEISSNQKGTFSLRFPVFEYLRDDKTEISMF